MSEHAVSTWMAVYVLAALVGSLRAEDIPALQARIEREDRPEPRPEPRLTIEAVPAHDGRH